MKAGYCEDENGNKSINRLAFIIGFIWDLLMTSIIFIVTGKSTESLVFFSATMPIIIGLKLVQKQIEKPSVNAVNSDNVN